MKRFPIRTVLAIVLFFAGCSRPPIYSTEYNLDFEYARNDTVPTQWMVRNPSLTGYGLTLDRGVKHRGQASFRAQRQAAPGMLSSWGGFQNFLPPQLVAGRQVEVSGWVRTRDSVNVCAGYSIFAYVPGKTEMDFLSRIDTLGGVRGENGWTRCTTRLKIDEQATAVMIAGFVTGLGTAWFDDMEIRIDGRKLRDRKLPALKTRLSDNDKRELREYVYPLRTPEPDADDTADLAPLGRLTARCRVVGLGECTHGTSEVYKMKDRIVRYLAANAGFDIFTIEANLPESYRMNDYTVGGKGDPKQLIRGMYVWPWMTREMLALVEWMRVYNASEPRLAFTGVDMQMYTTPMQRLRQQLEACPEAGRITRRTAAQIADSLRHIYPKPFQIDKDLARRLDARLGELSASTDIAALPDGQRDRVLQYVGLLRQFLSQCGDIDWRDRGMAANMAWILRQNPGSKAILWAHNQHINRLEGATRLSRPMGYYLKEALGDDYLALGFACYEGSYTAWQNGLKPFILPAPGPGSLEYLLGQLDEPLLLLDLKRMREQHAAALEWIDDLEFREIGATPEIFCKRHVSKAFDYLIFIRNTSPSHLLEF